MRKQPTTQATSVKTCVASAAQQPSYKTTDRTEWLEMYLPIKRLACLRSLATGFCYAVYRARERLLVLIQSFPRKWESSRITFLTGYPPARE
jgi:hypothetical protein